MKNGNPLVSVVMCTYNGARFVGEQLESILQQTYSPIEVVVADDASKDDTYELLQQYAARDGRIRLSRNAQNTGYNINFSNACAAATGDFIAIADQDDIWEPTKIAELMDAIQKDDNIVLVHGISARFEEREHPHLRSLKLVNYFRGNDLRLFYLSNYISGHNMLFRRRLLDRSLPFPGHVYYDWWLAAQACLIGRIEAVEKIQVWHRMHGGNATGGAKPRLAFWKQVQSILPTILESPDIQPAHRAFGQELLAHYQRDFPEKEFSWPLFWFLLKHAPVIFAYKKRTFPWISYTKHAARYASRKHLA
ncbi:glycosyltransferase family 2 protein [Flaviaesturariibacter aridisoli]|uniref:Glycosyltransferase family 2 protein n=1 Tax=Flaviaesturariibacter aridisoli TaxID=2545761 RepID=A0A4R4DVT4_9BACT|nr:glycosyltransferase family 2 protein [Flaviaesturariibacter aridisoli]TCZ67883.1 glycosyltransferase family 2 protein [Flaviaesturariibacter aridisoli]